MKRILWLITGVGVISLTGAQPDVESQVLATVLARHPQVRALRMELESARRLERGANLPHAPIVLLSPELTTGGVGEQFLLQQPLELNGARQARVRLARAEYALVRAQAELELNDLLADALAAYHEYAYRAQIATVAQEALQLAEQTREKIRLQVEVGARAGIDLIQADIERERVRQHAALRQAEAAAALERLRAALGGVSPDEVATADTRATPTPSLSPDTPLAVRIEQARLQAAQAQAQQIRVEGLPDLGVQVRIERFRDARTRPAFGLSVSLPFLDYGARQQQLRAQQQRAEAQQQRLLAARVRYEGERAAAQQRYEQARARAEAYQQRILPQAEQLVQATQTGLEVGQISILQLLEAQRTARQVREETLLATLELKLAEIELRRLRGEFAPYLEVFQ
ncbi:MAG: TolC family protein [Armatimonadota bacterium]|nr:TolC family protein [Armatimonadota bacterium]